MSAGSVAHQLCAIFSLLVLLLEQESWSFHPIDVHEFVTRFGHWEPVSISLTTPIVEVFELLVLGQHVLNVRDLDTGCFGNLLFEISGPVDVVGFLLVVHGRADLVLLLQNLDLLILAPDHHLKC